MDTASNQQQKWQNYVRGHHVWCCCIHYANVYDGADNVQQHNAGNLYDTVHASCIGWSNQPILRGLVYGAHNSRKGDIDTTSN